MERGWQNLELRGFSQDRFGFNKEDHGFDAEPTMNWSTVIVAERSDGVWFSVHGGVADSVVQEKRGEEFLQHISSVLSNMLRTLEDFRNCECAEKVKCEKHAAEIE